nr:hypothetical protein asmbl_33 [uncultured bacterium]
MKRSPGITVGLAIAVLLALFDVTLPFGGGDGRPVGAAYTSLALGVLTIAGVVLYAGGRRLGAPVVVVTRLLSAVVTLPTLVVGDVRTADRLLAGILVLLACVVVVTLVPTLRGGTRTARRVA